MGVLMIKGLLRPVAPACALGTAFGATAVAPVGSAVAASVFSISLTIDTVTANNFIALLDQSRASPS